MRILYPKRREASITTRGKQMETNKYRTQKQFNEIVATLINGDFDQAVNLVLDYGFYAKDLKKLVDHTFIEGEVFDSEDLYEVIETATRERSYRNVKAASKRLAQRCLDD
jgi:hypothetical protein